MRVQLVRRPGLLVINDAYNANPQSTVAALELLKELARRRAVAVLGTMRELGDYSEAGHREVGRAVARLGIDELITVGDEARLIGDEAVANGFPAPRAMACGNNAGAQAALAARLRAGDTVLVKGSRGLHMEEIVTYLEEHGPVDRGMGA
jgi:UDP-N-acetylmuramoyl-tripeptide--D-alanyl-D-alanine ligase